MQQEERHDELINARMKGKQHDFTRRDMNMQQKGNTRWLDQMKEK